MDSMDALAVGGLLTKTAMPVDGHKEISAHHTEEDVPALSPTTGQWQVCTQPGHLKTVKARPVQDCHSIFSATKEAGGNLTQMIGP